jgi:hypothetical protein
LEYSFSSLFYPYQAGSFTKAASVMARIHLMLMNIGTTAAATMMMHAGYQGVAAMLWISKKEFDETWDIHKLQVSARSDPVQLVPLRPIIIWILFHHYSLLRECINKVGADRHHQKSQETRNRPKRRRRRR